MRRNFWSISSRQVLVISTVIFLLCVEYQRERHTRIQQAASQRPVAKVMIEEAVDSVVDMEQVQGFAVLFRFLPPGRVESVDPILSRPDKVPMLRVVITQDDGSLRRLYVVLEGLEVVDTPNGVQLRRINKSQERQMVADGKIF